MLSLTTLASGSSGNSLLVSDGETHILIDAGISARRITKSLRELLFLIPRKLPDGSYGRLYLLIRGVVGKAEPYRPLLHCSQGLVHQRRTVGSGSCGNSIFCKKFIANF